MEELLGEESVSGPAPQAVEPSARVEFEPGTNFWEEEREWRVVAVKQKLPDGYRRSKLCVFYYDVALHPEGLPVEECEWTPLTELRDLVVAEQQVTSRFPRSLDERLRTITTHALMYETREQAGWDAFVFDEEAQAAIDAVYELRGAVMQNKAKENCRLRSSARHSRFLRDYLEENTRPDQGSERLQQTQARDRPHPRLSQGSEDLLSAETGRVAEAPAEARRLR